MKGYFLFLVFCIFSLFTIGQTPGGVSLGLSQWLRADLNVFGTPVNTWWDQTFPFTDPTINGDPTLISLNPSNFNYNPCVAFDGTGDFLSWTGLTTGFTIGEIFSLHRLSSVSFTPNRELWSFDVLGNGSSHPYDLDGNVYDDFGGNAMAVGDLTAIVDMNEPYIYNTNVALVSGTNYLKSNYTQGQFTNSLSFTGAAFPDDPTYGNGDFTGSQDFLGEIGEVILYDRDLSLSERTKIWTYLAVKYGLTLSNILGGTNGDYVSTNNTTIWNASLSARYDNDVIGIGRDDTEFFVQRQSHSLDDSLRIYLSTLATTNALNGGIFSSNNSYVMIGHDAGKVCTTVAANSEMPTGLTGCTLYSRLEREWKVTKTNLSQSFNLDIELAGCASVSTVLVADLRLLVDDNGDFSDGGTTCYYNGDGTGIVLSYSGASISVSNISNTQLANNSTSYISIGSATITTPLPISLLDFSAIVMDNRWVDLTWITASEKDNDFFIIEKSTDFENWQFVEKVNGAGNSTATINYQTRDNSPFTGVSYYRLIQYDNNGDFSIEGVRTVAIVSEDNRLKIYPNPTNGLLTIYGEKEELESLQLFNALGQPMDIEFNIGDAKVNIDLSFLAAGIYLLKSNKESYRIVKQ